MIELLWDKDSFSLDYLQLFITFLMIYQVFFVLSLFISSSENYIFPDESGWYHMISIKYAHPLTLCSNYQTHSGTYDLFKDMSVITGEFESK